ncbi:MAG TPA: hypothetical protein PLP75_01995 [Burkholderiales bacterium]|jgi:hypothetical protein|nr:hypothetical protein [Burkholderiales bacterium]
MTTLNHASKTTPVTNLENTIALTLDMTEEDKRRSSIQNMVKDVEKNAEALVD